MSPALTRLRPANPTQPKDRGRRRRHCSFASFGKQRRVSRASSHPLKMRVPFRAKGTLPKLKTRASASRLLRWYVACTVAVKVLCLPEVEASAARTGRQWHFASITFRQPFQRPPAWTSASLTPNLTYPVSTSIRWAIQMLENQHFTLN
eukprot:scaffold270834_cov28-Tisochrysis_lutea.AAC.2